MRFRYTSIIVLIILSVILAAGCSNGKSSNTFNPVTPSLSSGSTNSANTLDTVKHSLLGLYSCVVDESGIEFVPLRDTMFHLNALRFLEPPPPVRIQISNFSFDGQIVDVDVQFIHPFEGLDQFTGFDVCGIVISSGSYTGFTDPDIVVAVDGDTRLINPDGLARWWNPREFPYNESIPMWGYIDGYLGTPDDVANFTATLNGYKYHADGLTVYDDLTALDPAQRGAFSAGSGHTRHYTIDMADGFVFNYAVDAAWLPPEGDPPVIVPDDFPPSANRDEPYFLSAGVTENTLTYNLSTGLGGGDLRIQVDCYDWFGADENTVRVESPGVFSPAISDTPIGGADVFSTYLVDFSGSILTSADPVQIWVSAEAGMDYDGLLPGKPTATYLPSFDVEVEEITSGTTITLIWNDENVIEHNDQADFNDIEPALIENGVGEIILSFFWYEIVPDHIWNHPKFVRSYDNGHIFGYAENPQWISHGSNLIDSVCWNSKLTLGSNGHAFHSYWSPQGQTVQAVPKLPVLDETCSYDGTEMENAGEMLYTIDGYPMMFGDKDGKITMRRGDYPNHAGTMTWPAFSGMEYTLLEEENINSWLSVSRSAMKTSDGICHLMFWSQGLPYIRMMSSADTSGISWNEPVNVFEGLAEIWAGGQNPGMWIDDEDGFHCVFAGKLWWGEYQLMYGYSVDGADFSEMTSFKAILKVPVEDGMNDTQVVVFDAFDETWIFISYETGGNVYCVYKAMKDSEFSEPVPVNEHLNAMVPDIYPNGDTGVVFAYQADDGSGSELTDVYYRLAEFILE